MFRDIEERRRLAIAITYLTTIRHTVGEKSLRSRNVMRGMRGLILWPSWRNPFGPSLLKMWSDLGSGHSLLGNKDQFTFNFP